MIRIVVQGIITIITTYISGMTNKQKDNISLILARIVGVVILCFVYTLISFALFNAVGALAIYINVISVPLNQTAVLLFSLSSSVISLLFPSLPESLIDKEREIRESFQEEDK